MYTWQPEGHRIIAPSNRPYIPSITVYGAVGMPLKEPVFMFGPATNSVGFKLFLEKLLRHKRNPYDTRRPWLVLDNHPAHYSHMCRRILNE